MNIAIFTHNYPKEKKDRKDAGIFIYDFVEELKKYHGIQKPKVFVFCPDYKNSKKFGNWSIYNPLNIINFLVNISYGIRESLKFVQKNEIDYILCAWAIPSGIYAYLAKLKFKIPYGIWFLGSDLNVFSKIPVLNIIIRIVSRNADNLFANSYSLTRVAKNKYGQCSMLPASTKIENKESKLIKLDTNKVNILYVGRLEKIKGPDLLIEEVKKLDSKYIIRIIGDGTMRKKLEGMVDNVEFLGQLGLLEISGYMKASDFLIVPSRNESMPLVILEAANYKLPVLANDVGDCKYILDKYKIGQTSVKIKDFDYKYFRDNGRFDDLVVDYDLKRSVKLFLNKIL